MSLVAASPAAAAPATPDTASLTPESGAYFGVSIDWGVDTAVQQAQRLGEAPAVLEHATAVPITATESDYLAQFFRQAEGAGALPAITLRPEGDLFDFDADAAEAVVAALAKARGGNRIPVYVRFAPDMNATWVPWGQRPTSFVDAFRLFADAVHDGLPGAATVWSPAAGEGYPFESASTTTDAALDTDGNGRLAAGDDPYGPYYPGARYVDWVGLSAYHDPSDGGPAVNAVPVPGELDVDLSGAGDLDFYARFAVATDTPMMLETAAFYAPGAGGASALAIKSAWWQQVMASASDAAHPLLDAVIWRDSSSTRAVVGEV
ncbi:MAG TPA: OpgC domain-containing protein, partial [Microbacterium sp.]|nr:OpgC domain-containing protein [Microbacterium sp.]